MKKIIFAIAVCFYLHTTTVAQNYGFGTSEPLNRVHVVGNFLVTSPSYGTSADPTPAEHITMVNGNVHTIPILQLTGRFYDPGGQSGNYSDNLSTSAMLFHNSNDIGIEFNIESMNLGTGDSLIIKIFPDYNNPVVFAAGNGNNITGKWVFPGPAFFTILFKSNSDGNNGEGFSLKFRRLYVDEAALNATPVLSGHAGNSMYFDIRKGSFGAGKIDASNQGEYAAAMGYTANASGDYSVAMGQSPRAIGYGSTAIGPVTHANGDYSTAFGSQTTAEGNYSTAMGKGTDAKGTAATAMGYGSVAAGNYSTAMGYVSVAVGSYSTAMGDHTQANGSYSTTMGNNTKATNTYSTAMGNKTTAAGISATAMGDNSAAGGDYSTAMGNASTASGNYSTAMGDHTEATGSYSTTMGNNTKATDTYSTAMGNKTTAAGISATAMGDNSTAGGDYSTVMGRNCAANGIASTASGGYSVATGDYSTAMGYGSGAGERSTAMGDNAIASGAKSTAMGYYAKANGPQSTAIGNYTTASGSASTAMGNFVSTNNKNGALIIGDNSTTTVTNSANPNTFRARFDGGYIFYTSGTLSSYCLLAAGANAWSTASDKQLKENLAPTDGEDFLKKIAKMELTTWNYRSQDAKTFRHYGPMAQDFYAAFGKDKYGTIGNDSTINSADFDGVNLVAIQALEKRTTAQKMENEELKNMLLQMRKEMDELKKNKNCDCDCPANSFTKNN